MEPPSGTDLRPHELLDDGFAPPPCDVLVIGCGNILRGDDAVGPVLVRTLFERGVPDGVRLVDGGTAGMDVAFGMRGAARVVIVDAARTGQEPGTLYRVPADQLGDLPPLDGLHSHNFRWDHALSFGDWLLGPERPRDVTVLLIEAGSLEPGAPLTAPVQEAMERACDLLAAEFWPPADPAPAEALEVEVTDLGYLHLERELAERCFPSDVCVARVETEETGAGPQRTLVLVALHSAAHGGLVLKQRDRSGRRSLLINEVLAFDGPSGRFPAVWDDGQGALRVLLGDGRDGRPTGLRRDDGGLAGARPVGGAPGGDLLQRGGPATPAGLPERGEGPAGGGRRTPDRGAASRTAGGAR